MNSSETTQPGGAEIAAQALIPSSNSLPQRNGALPEIMTAQPKLGSRTAGYGLPCAKCRTYYAADLDTCPVCRSNERVSPLLQSLPASAPSVPEEMPDPATLEQERERFLQEFQAQAHSTDLQINATSSFRCSRQENHEGSFEPAAICQGCYDHLREQSDQFEAALHIDLKEATQIIYDAVWADPSDPTKTYQNAAQSLLNELRRRAGIPSVLGPMQPLQH